MWSVKIHDFGKQWIESSWGKVDPHPGKRGFKGKSLNKEQNEKRARARATGEIRRKCLSIGADHLVTLTYRDNVEDRERVLTDLERLRRMLSRSGYSMPYVAVLECQKRGAIHPHLAVRGFQDIRLLRRCWYKIVGKAQGQVNVKRASTWNVSGQTRSISLQVPQQRHRQPATRVRGAPVLLLFGDRRADRTLSARPGAACQRVRSEDSSPSCSRTRQPNRRVLHGKTLERRGWNVRMDIRVRGPDMPMVKLSIKPPALTQSWAEGRILDARDEAAIVPVRLSWRDCLPEVSHRSGLGLLPRLGGQFPMGFLFPIPLRIRRAGCHPSCINQSEAARVAES